MGLICLFFFAFYLYIKAAEMSFSKNCHRIHKIRQNKKGNNKKITKDLRNTRWEIQVQTKLDQPSRKDEHHQTADKRPKI
jgi:hypothetical protein